MANEIKITAKLSFSDGSTRDAFEMIAAQFDASTNRILRNTQLIGSSEEALLLGDVSSGGSWFLGVNRSATQWVAIRAATGETDCVYLGPGELALFKFSSNASAPYVIAGAADTKLEYLLVN